ALPPPPNSWAAQADAGVAIWTVQLEPGARFPLPAAPAGVNRRLYFFAGRSLTAAGAPIPARHAFDVRAERDVLLEAGPDGAELLLLQGRPIGEPVVQYGPFVMNTPEEIRETFVEYQRTRFGGWPWE